MCLLGIAFRQFQEFQLLVLANREELYARPAAGPRIFPSHGASPAWMAGIDLAAGGTWLGVNEFGLLVAVTNRKKTSPPENPPSRGLLCRSLLMFRETASAAETARSELEANRYAGCNLLIADRESALVIEAGDQLKMTALPPGLHLLANAELNPDDDLRIRRVRAEFESADPVTESEWLRTAQRICGLPADGNEPPICLTGADRGTVSSTVLGIGRDFRSSRYWYAAGPPDRTPYVNLTPLFRELLGGPSPVLPPDAKHGACVSADIEPPYDSPARRLARERVAPEIKDRSASDSAPGSVDGKTAPYRILLRGPWECEPLARAERDATGKIVWSTSDIPPPSTVRLPAAWQDLFGTFRGRIRFRRRFHPPSNVTGEDRLYIVFDGLNGAATISINGHLLGTVASPQPGAKFDVTKLLCINNALEINLEFTDSSAETSAGGLFAPVALEIHGQ